MLIDWFTVLVQFINFLVLIVLLKKFLYGPILKAIDDRSQAMDDQLSEVAQKRKEAEHEAELYQDRVGAFDTQREAMIVRANEETEAYRKELISEARLEIDGIKSRWHKAIQHEKDSFLHDLRARTHDQVQTIVRRVLSDLSDSDLEQQIVVMFIHQIQTLTPEACEAIVGQSSAAQAGIIRSGFDMPPPLRQRLTTVLHEKVDGGLDIQFETDVDLICGIELKAGGYKIAWHMEEYLQTLEANISQALEEVPGNR